MPKRDLRPLLDAVPLPTPEDSLVLDHLRWVLGDALPERQRARMPALQPLAKVGRPVVERR